MMLQASSAQQWKADRNDESAVLQGEYRRVMSHFCTGVVIVSAMDGLEPVGLTCQAFSSLSLSPPLVMLGIGVQSTSWPKIERAGAFCVSVLSREQHPLAERFARSGGHKFDELDWRCAPSGAPFMPGCVAWIDCALQSAVETGDHLIVVGEVTAMDTDLPLADPLLFYQGSFTELARPQGTRYGAA
jgi:3-hydroxy-9,10-secoandrosta-1,3,5(10)-triene-9,17-dione monooxygenase reductase component